MSETVTARQRQFLVGLASDSLDRVSGDMARGQAKTRNALVRRGLVTFGLVNGEPAYVLTNKGVAAIA